MNYFHRKTYLQLLERREMVLQQHRDQEDRMRLAEDYAYSPIRSTYVSDMASPETVHGSAAATPQGVGRT